MAASDYDRYAGGGLMKLEELGKPPRYISSTPTPPMPGHALQVRLADATGTLIGYLTNFQARTVTQRELTLSMMDEGSDPEMARAGIEAPAIRTVRIPIGQMTRTVSHTALIAADMTPEAFKTRLASMGVPPYAVAELDEPRHAIRYTWPVAQVDLATAHDLFDLDEFIPA